jgi:hypothetical protein
MIDPYIVAIDSTLLKAFLFVFHELMNLDIVLVKPLAAFN